MRWIILLFIFITGCGYRLGQQENPLSQYEIQSISIPMFYNYSNLSGVSADFTRETYRLFTGFSGLKLYSGYSERSDAVLIGIIRSSNKITDTLRGGNLREGKNKLPDASSSNRPEFYFPGTTSIDLSLQIIVIKKPTEEDIALLQSGISSQIRANSKIIFNEFIPVRSSYTREVLDEKGSEVIATQNAGIQRKTLKNMAVEAATSVRDMILYAF